MYEQLGINMKKWTIYININAIQSKCILIEIRVLLGCFKAFPREEWKDNYR